MFVVNIACYSKEMKRIWLNIIMAEDQLNIVQFLHIIRCQTTEIQDSGQQETDEVATWKRSADVNQKKILTSKLMKSIH